MRVKFWLSSVVAAIRVRPNRNARRQLNKRRASRQLSLRWLLVAALVLSAPWCETDDDDFCSGPLFPGSKFPTGDPSYSVSVTSGDFNGDGIIDMATANFDSMFQKFGSW